MELHLNHVLLASTLLTLFNLCYSIRYLPNPPKNNSGFILPILPVTHPNVQTYLRKLEKMNIVGLQMYDERKHVFVVDLSVGSPAITVYVVYDTGSSFTWIHDYAFAVEESTSYKPVLCDQDECSRVPGTGCSADEDNVNICSYTTPYLTATSSGTVGTDLVHFKDVSMRLTFGSSTYTSGNFSFDGTFGVDFNNDGLRRYLPYDTFSSCFPKDGDTKSYLRFGDEAQLEGSVIPFYNLNSHLGFDVQAILINNVEASIPAHLLRSQGFIFDTGAAVSYLLPQVMDELIKLAQNNIPNKPAENPLGSSDFELCYDMETMSTAPFQKFQMTFELDHGGLMVLDWRNVWVKGIGNQYCFGFQRHSKYNIFGAAQMRGFNFGFDRLSNKMYYEINDCRFEDES